MEIFEFAMAKEKHAEEYYRELADQTDHAGLKTILTMLADEEAKHAKVVERMMRQTPQAFAESPVLASAKDVFERMQQAAETFDFDISEVDLYRKACDIETASRKYYLEKAKEVEDDQQEALFRKLAEEENKHLLLVQHLCDFVSQPETYLEDAEFYHFDDYVEGQF